jgi:hypothetical protein
MANQALVTSRRTAGYHGPRRPFNDTGRWRRRRSWPKLRAENVSGGGWLRPQG